MSKHRKIRVSKGSVAAYAFVVLYLATIGVGAAYHWRALDDVLAVLSIALLAWGSVVVIWRAWRHRGQPGGPRLGQLDALPRRWRAWVLGEHDEDGPGPSSRRTH